MKPEHIGTNAAERLGSVLVVVGAALLLLWLFTDTELDSWVRSSYSRSSYISELFCTRLCDTTLAWARGLLGAGLALRFIVTPAWRWLRTGRLRP